MLSDRMGVVSSKRQVKEKGRSGWSPVKTSTQSKEPPPLPSLVSDLGAQLERVGDGRLYWQPHPRQSLQAGRSDS